MNNDLISREALKEKLKPCEADVCEFSCEGCHFRVVTAEDIDNAPTVEIPVARWDAYCEGQKVGYEKALSERPQGQWAFDEKGYFYCDHCGKYPHDQYATTDFCPNCGACMQKGDKE